MLALILAQAAAPATEPDAWIQRIIGFLDTPLPYSPFSEYLLVLFVLWLLARRADRRPNTFDTQAQDVLDEKFQKGEISRAAYEKYRQQMALEQKR